MKFQSENTYISYQTSSHGSLDVERGGVTGGPSLSVKDDKTKITKTYHTIKDMISSKFNSKQKEAVGPGGSEDSKHMNNHQQVNMTNGTTVLGSRERLIDGFPNQVEGVQGQFQGLELRDRVQRTPPSRDPRNMPPLPVLRSSQQQQQQQQQPNFSGLSEVISPIQQSPQRRGGGGMHEQESVYQRRGELEVSNTTLLLTD